MGDKRKSGKVDDLNSSIINEMKKRKLVILIEDCLQGVNSKEKNEHTGNNMESVETKSIKNDDDETTNICQPETSSTPVVIPINTTTTTTTTTTPPPTTSNNSSEISNKSITLRSRGNIIYKKFLDSTNFQDQKNYLQSAIHLYRQAYEIIAISLANDSSPLTTTNSAIAASAAKNCGVSTWRLIDILKEINSNSSIILNEYRMAILFFGKAILFGKIKIISMGDSWINDIIQKYINCTQSTLEYIKENLCIEHRMSAMQKIINSMTDENSQKSLYFLEIIRYTFNMSVVALGNKDYKRALHALHDCYHPIQECKRWLNDFNNYGLYEYDKEYIENELKIIDKDVSFHLASAESLQAISFGDQLLKTAVHDYEILSMDLVYDVIDWYRKALIGAREIEVEVEAIALSKLGSVYDKIFKIRYKAKEYFLRCMQMGVSLSPRNFNSEVWFMTCMEALKRFQEETIKNDDEAKQQERKIYLEQLKIELNDLKNMDGKCCYGPSDLIRYIYKTYPPKDSTHVITEQELDNCDGIKKCLLKAILHYHPDKQDVDKYGKKWTVLCEEICKMFTARYEHFKIG